MKIIIVFRSVTWVAERLPFYFKCMGLSVRTRIKERQWTKLILEIPEGRHVLPGKWTYDVFWSFKAICVRRSKTDETYHYYLNIRKGTAVLNKVRKSHGESD